MSKRAVKHFLQLLKSQQLADRALLTQAHRNVAALQGGRLARRFASEAAPSTSSASQRVHHKLPFLTARRLLSGSAFASLMAAGAYVGTRDAETLTTWQFYFADFAAPFLRLFDPETAHHIAIWGASWGLTPREMRPDPPALGLTLWRRYFSNPLGLAAGFDKDAEAVEPLLGMGFGHMEVGSVTPLPQPGNPKPRVFRLPEEKAVINRYGFNSQGIVAVARRLGARHGRQALVSSTAGDDPSAQQKSQGHGILGVNLGKNKETVDAAADYVQGVHTLAQYADYLVINISSPNTPGLRKLQGRKQLQDLLRRVLAARDEMQWGKEGPPPLVLKIAPDLSHKDLEDIAAVALSLLIDGIIVSNTTIQRPESIRNLPHGEEAGGLSGPPLFEPSTDVLREIYRLTKGRIPLIGCGGVSSGRDAFEKIKAGASLVQLYTAMVYDGPAVVPRIKAELLKCLEEEGFKSVAEAVGAGIKL